MPNGDQADGLRRLLGAQRTRVLRLNSSRRGVGKTACAINLAAALTAQGCEVLIIDENNRAKNVADGLGQLADGGFIDVVRGCSTIEESIRRSEGIDIFPVASALTMLPNLSHDQRRQLSEAITATRSAFDVVLVDTEAGATGDLLSIPLRDQTEILVVAATTSAITDAYAFIKRINTEYGKRRYQILMTRVRDPQQADTLFRNMAGVARQYLGVELSMLGMIGTDDAIKRAAGMGLSLATAFPDAKAVEGFRSTAQAITRLPQPASRHGLNDLLLGLLRCGFDRYTTPQKHSPPRWRDPDDARPRLNHRTLPVVELTT